MARENYPVETQLAASGSGKGQVNMKNCRYLAKHLLAAILLGASSFAMWAQAAPSPKFDLVITNGHIIDGTGSPWYSGDIGIREGKIAAIRYARENGIPYLGICLGMQLAVIEYARHKAGLANANSTEFDTATPHPVVALITEWQNRDGSIEHRDHRSDLGGTMRLDRDLGQSLRCARGREGVGNHVRAEPAGELWPAEQQRVRRGLGRELRVRPFVARVQRERRRADHRTHVRDQADTSTASRWRAPPDAGIGTRAREGELAGEHADLRTRVRGTVEIDRPRRTRHAGRVARLVPCLPEALERPTALRAMEHPRDDAPCLVLNASVAARWASRQVRSSGVR